MEIKADRYRIAKEAVRLEDVARGNLIPKGKSYVCPFCGSGSHANGTPAFSIKGEKWHCFSCDRGGDVFDLVGAITGETDRGEQLRRVEKMAGIDPNADKGKAYSWNDTVTVEPNEKPTPVVPDYSDGRFNTSLFIDICEEAMTETCDGWKYMLDRGFTPDTIRKHRIGWDMESRTVVIPYSNKEDEYYYIARKVDVDTRAKGKYRKPSSDVVGAEPLFYPEALNEPIVFVVEGSLDAIAIHEEGYPAVAINSAKSYEKLVRKLTEIHYDGVIISWLDNDTVGREATAGFAAALDEVKINHIEFPVESFRATDTIKDAGQAISEQPLQFTDLLSETADRAKALVKEREQVEYRDALDALKVRGAAEVMEDLRNLKDAAEPIPTGLQVLDTALDGGLPVGGVTILGAISSMGKTTLMAQIADNIAESGYPVLFVSIEQGAREIVGKSLTRLAYGNGVTITTAELNSPRRRKRWDDTTKAAFDRACDHYRDSIAPNLVVYEGTNRPTVAAIRSVADEVAKHVGTAPVVFIDYLQLIKPSSDRFTDKQAVDEAVTALRQMASQLRTSVFVVSALNRASYSGAVSMDSFRESSGIEYGADVALGLQPAGIADSLAICKESEKASTAKQLTDAAKRKDVRDLEISILKNRNGAMPPMPVPVTLYAKAGVFKDGNSVSAPVYTL